MSASKAPSRSAHPRRRGERGGGGGVPCWFGPEHRPLLAFVHGARPGRRAPGVVLCPPLARELQSAHYALRRLADRLAAAGMIAVRFDYDGTGDSAGDSAGDGAEPDRIEAWLASIEAAVALARRRGARSISLLGVRMGALLAELVARRLDGLEALALWDPCASGRSFVRQQRLLQRLEARDAAAGPAPNELLGFELDEGALEALSALQVPPAERRLARRILLVHRPKDPGLGRLLERLGDGPVECAPVRREDRLDVEPLAAKAPAATIELLTEWFAETLAPPRSGGAAPTWSATPPATVGTCRAGAITERVVRLGPTGLVGVETLPPAPDPARPTVLMLTTATDHRIGPNRLWVDLARAWAALGFRSVRFDGSGIGDSPTRPGQPDQVMRPIEAFDDVVEVAAALSPDDPANVVLVGLCSGAYQALESALELGARGVLAINPAVVFTPPEVAGGGIVDGRRRVCRLTPAVVRSARRLVPAPVRQCLVPASLRRRVVPTLVRAGRAGGGPGAAAWLGELVAGGIDTYVVCSEGEGIELFEEAGLALPALEASGLVKVELVGGLDHALIPAAQRRGVAGLLTDHLVDRFGARPSDTGARSVAAAV